MVHRDYDYSGCIIINIYEDRIEFVSLGGLVKGITVIDILNGVSQPSNSIIADVFYRLELIESYGTGIRKIFESYSEALFKPEIKPAPTSFVIILPKLISLTVVVSQKKQKEEILRLITDKDEIFRKDIESSLSIPKHTAIKLLNELLEERRIKKIWYGQSGSMFYKIKCILP